MPDASSLDRTQSVIDRSTAHFDKDPAVSTVASVTGYSLIDGQNKANAGVLFLSLKGFEERKVRGAASVIADGM